MVSLALLCDHAPLSPPTSTSPYTYSEEDSHSFLVADQTSKKNLDILFLQQSQQQNVQ